MTQIAQNWLDAKYSDKKIGGKIELSNGTAGVIEELTGELLIDGYNNIEIINLEPWDKTKGLSGGGKLKGQITRITIKNCPKVKKLNLNKNEIREIIFEGDFLDLGRLDATDNKLTEIDISKLPNLTWLNITRNPLTEIKGLEYSTKFRNLNLCEAPGFNGQEYGKWKNAIKNMLNIPLNDPLPNTWETDLKTKSDELEKRPTLEQLTAVEQERDSRPNIKKEDWEKVQAELDKIKDLIGLGSDDTLPANWENQLVNKNDLDQATKKVQDYENGLKTKLGLDDNNLVNWKDEIDKLKNRPTSDSIKDVLGLKSTDALPTDWPTKLAKKDDLATVQNNLKEWTDKFPGKNPNQVDNENKERVNNLQKELDTWKDKLNGKTPEAAAQEIAAANQNKDKLNGWQTKFPNKTPEQVEKELNDLKSKPVAGAITQEEYDKVVRQRDSRPEITAAQYKKISKYMRTAEADDNWESEILGSDWKAEIQQAEK